MINKIEDISVKTDEGRLLLAALPILRKYVFKDLGYNKVLEFLNQTINQSRKPDITMKEGK